MLQGEKLCLPAARLNEVYQALLKKGYSKGKAARIAQSQTGEALATGRPPKHPVWAASTTEAPPPPASPRQPQGRKGPEYALAAANDPIEDFTTPSSSRVTPSPGMQVLNELRRAKEAGENDVERGAGTVNSESAHDPRPTAHDSSARDRHVARLVRLGYAPEAAEAKAAKIFAGMTPAKIEEIVKSNENMPDSYFTDAFTGGGNAQAGFRRAMNARGANRRFANGTPLLPGMEMDAGEDPAEWPGDIALHRQASRLQGADRGRGKPRASRQGGESRHLCRSSGLSKANRQGRQPGQGGAGGRARHAGHRPQAGRGGPASDAGGPGPSGAGGRQAGHRPIAVPGGPGERLERKAKRPARTPRRSFNPPARESQKR